jgi:hypothetical protein
LHFVSQVQSNEKCNLNNHAQSQDQPNKKAPLLFSFAAYVRFPTVIEFLARSLLFPGGYYIPTNYSSIRYKKAFRWCRYKQLEKKHGYDNAIGTMDIMHENVPYGK